MHKKKVFLKNGRSVFRVDKVFNQSIRTIYIDAGYQIGILKNGLTDTGLLQVFKLEATHTQLPSFIGRWDDVAETLDVDMFGGSAKARQNFYAGRNGCAGHHPMRTSDTARVYVIRIELSNKVIFDGLVSFNINHGHDPKVFK